MSAQGGKEEIKARLLAAGAPPHVVEHVLEQPISRWAYWFPVCVLFLVVIGGFAVGALMWGRLEALTQANARAHALSAGGLLYATNFGVSMLVALFGWILVSGWICGSVALVSKRVMASSFVFSVLDARKTVATMVRVSLKRLSTERDPERFVRRFSTGWAAWCGLLATPLVVLSIVLVPRDLQAHSIFTPEAHVRSPLLPWASSEPEPWSAAARVELGCNHVSGDDADDHLVYEIAVASGASVRIPEDADPVSGTWLDRIEVIDAALGRSDAEFQRWTWLDRDPLHPLCLRAKEREYGAANYPRILRLLRVGELDGDLSVSRRPE
jgi:hypothetical protein